VKRSFSVIGIALTVEQRRAFGAFYENASDAEVDHPSARVDADLMSTTGVPSNTSIGPIFTREALVAP
jgi:hypothetical protein